MLIKDFSQLIKLKASDKPYYIIFSNLKINI